MRGGLGIIKSAMKRTRGEGEMLGEGDKGVAFLFGKKPAGEVSGVEDGSLVKINPPRQRSSVEKAQIEADIVPGDHRRADESEKMGHDIREQRGICKHIRGDVVDIDHFLGDIALGLNEGGIGLRQGSSLHANRADLTDGIDLGAESCRFQIEDSDGDLAQGEAVEVFEFFHRFFGVETPAFRRGRKRCPFFVRRRIHRCVEGYDSVCKKCLVWCHFGF